MFKKTKEFAKTHKKELITAGVIVGCVAVGVGAFVIARRAKQAEKIVEGAVKAVTDAFDAGRLCTMSFTVKETGELLGAVDCWESYARDLLDIC